MPQEAADRYACRHPKRHYGLTERLRFPQYRLEISDYVERFERQSADDQDQFREQSMRNYIYRKSVF